MLVLVFIFPRHVYSFIRNASTAVASDQYKIRYTGKQHTNAFIWRCNTVHITYSSVRHTEKQHTNALLWRCTRVDIMFSGVVERVVLFGRCAGWVWVVPLGCSWLCYAVLCRAVLCCVVWTMIAYRGTRLNLQYNLPPTIVFAGVHAVGGNLPHPKTEPNPT